MSQSSRPSWLHTFASACLSGRCCSPGTASYLADSQGLTGSLVYPAGLPIQMDPSSIPSYSFHGAHMDITTCHRLSQLPFPRLFPRAPRRRPHAVCIVYPLASNRRRSAIDVRPNVEPDALNLLQAEDPAPRGHLAFAVEDGMHEAGALVRP